MKAKMTKKLFFDTYALIELGKGSPNYEPYSKDVVILLNKLNLLEFSYYLLKEKRENEIEKIFQQYLRFSVNYDEEILIKAAEMKFKFLKERLSFIDCIGYFLAKKHGALFLTGDGRFRNKENVEFVK